MAIKKKTILKKPKDEFKLSFWGIFSRAWKLFNSLILIIVLIFYILLNTLNGLFLTPALTNVFTSIHNGSFNLINMTNLFVLIISFLIVVLIFSFIYIMLIIFVNNSVVKKKEIQLGEIINQAWKKFWRFIGISLLYSLFVFIFLVILLLPIMLLIDSSTWWKIILLILVISISLVLSVLFGVYWFFAYQAIILKDKSWKSALNYSSSLVKGRWWKVFGYYLLLAIFEIGVLVFLFLSVGSLLKSIYSIILVLYFTITSIITLFSNIFYTVFFTFLEKN